MLVGEGKKGTKKVGRKEIGNEGWKGKYKKGTKVRRKEEGKLKSKEVSKKGRKIGACQVVYLVAI